MRIIPTLALLLVSVVPAAAENDVNPAGREMNREPDAYISSGAIAGTDHFSYGGVVLEAGRRIGSLRETPLFIRAMAHGGNTRVAGNPGRGTYVEARGGIEGRQCTRTGMVCASVGLDIGIHRGRYDHIPLDDNGRPINKPAIGEPMEDNAHFETFDTAVLAPRLTVDGGNRVRVRGVLERPYHFHKDGGTGGVAVSLMLGLGF